MMTCADKNELMMVVVVSHYTIVVLCWCLICSGYFGNVFFHWNKVWLLALALSLLLLKKEEEKIAGNKFFHDGSAKYVGWGD
jgi:hypothetical protein